jgi:hypothetical protein
MHTFRNQYVEIIHNGDYSGDVFIRKLQTGVDSELAVPFDSLKEFIAAYVRNRKISALEDETDADRILIGEIGKLRSPRPPDDPTGGDRV